MLELDFAMADILGYNQLADQIGSIVHRNLVVVACDSIFRYVHKSLL
jgi:hypothetical protein